MQIKKLFIFTICFFISNAIIAQHFGGLYFSLDRIPTQKNYWVTEKTDNYFNDHHFSNGHSIGYQGLFMENKRVSFTYGLQYTLRTTFVENYNMIPQCGTGLKNYNFGPLRMEQSWNYVEVPLGIRYNILKGSKFQPYISMNIIVNYPMSYTKKYIDTQGEEIHSPYLQNNYKKRIDGAIELGVGLNYKIKNFILNIQPTYRPFDGYEKIGMGFAILRKF